MNMLLISIILLLKLDLSAVVISYFDLINGVWVKKYSGIYVTYALKGIIVSNLSYHYIQASFPWVIVFFCVITMVGYTNVFKN